MNIPKKIIVHHSAAPRTQSLGEINAYHKSIGFTLSSLGSWVGYHYVILADGTLSQTRLDSDEGCHTVGQNTSSLGICLLGNFDVELPTTAQIASLKTFLEEKTLLYGIPQSEIFPHRKFSPKSCYGSRLSDKWAMQVLQVSILESLLKKLLALIGKR